MIIREKYLKNIRPFYDIDLIKVITGIRRSGKSTMLNQIMDELKANGVSDGQIIYINLEYDDFDFMKDYKDLSNYIKKQIINNNKYYLFIDEIQNIVNWEKSINSFKAKMKDNISIFITGSNSDLLSGELATLISGRYVNFKIYPFSFEEVCEISNIDDKEELFNDYILWGGLPQRFQFKNDSEKRVYLSDIYDAIILKDIVKRFKIKDIDLFNRIVEYIVTTPSQTFSVESIIKFFKGDNRDVPKETIYNYLEYMCKALLISKVERYDLRGKRILTGKYKYYLTDLGLGQVKNMNKKVQNGAYLENIVYNELVSRGYDVNVGIIENGEIDFIATKSNEKEYYQVSYILADENVVEREFGAFKKINDNYPKYVITMDKLNFSQNGIIHKNIIDWLLEK